MSEPPFPLDDGAGSPARRSSGRRTLLVGVGLALGVVVGIVAATLLLREPPVTSVGDTVVRIDEARPAADERMPLPPVTLAGFDGGPAVELGAYRGRPLVVNFWASWCAPCVEEMPDFQEVATATDAVAFLGVNVKDAPSSAQTFVRDLGITYDLAADPQGDFSTRMRLFGMPTTLFVDRNGTVVYRHTGALDASELREMIATHLGAQV